MKRFLAPAFLVAASCTMAVADTSAERDIKLAGDAMLYGGDIGDPTGPTPRDAKLFLDLTGKAAQRAYELLGASSEMHGGECDDPEVTSRHKGDVTCMHDKQGYACYLGFDLVRGKSIASSVC